MDQTKSSVKTIIYIIVAIIVIVAVYFALTQKIQSPTPTNETSDSLRFSRGAIPQLLFRAI